MRLPQPAPDKMTRLLSLIGALICIALPAYAGNCTYHDAWKGEDKNLHLMGGAFLGIAGTNLTGNPWLGFAGASVVALAWEARSGLAPRGEGRGQCSAQDLIVGMIGAGLGAYAADWSLGYDRRAVRVGYARTF
jgi:hypothetical protein